MNPSPRMVSQSLHHFVEKRVPSESRVDGADRSLRATLKRMNDKYKQSLLEGPSSVSHSESTAAPSLTVHAQRSSEDKAFVDSLKNKIVYLRHAFRQADASHSGTVNAAEFRSTMTRAGYAKDDDVITKRLFDASAELAADGATYGTHARWRGSRADESKGQLLDVGLFLRKLEATKPSTGDVPAVSKTVGATAEERRVLRRAFLATHTSANSSKLFKELSDSTPGSVSVSRLKEGLTTLGANMSSSEMDVVVDAVGVRPNGRVDIAEFDAKLSQSIAYFDRVAGLAAQGSLRRNKRYHDSFRSHEDLLAPVGGQGGGQVDMSEYADGIAQSKHFRRERVLWAKLQRTLQDKQEDIVGKLGGGVPVRHLAGHLSDLGVNLGREDVQQLEARLGCSDRSSSVSLEAFCDVAGIRLKLDERGRRSCAGDRAVDAAEGVFAGSRGSVLGNPSYSASMLRDGKTDSACITTFVKRRAPIVLQEHTFEPSKFWAMKHDTHSSDLRSAMPEERGRSGSPSSRHKWGKPTARRGKRSSSAPAAVKLSDLLVESSILKSLAANVAQVHPPKWASRTLAEFIMTSQPMAAGQQTLGSFVPGLAQSKKTSLKKHAFGANPAGRQSLKLA